MPVIAVVNRKGGSGKSTFAAHVAAWCARQGHSVMLGDVDRQQSSRAWLKRRDAALPAIAAWGMAQWKPIIDWLRPVLQPPPGASNREPISTQASRMPSSRNERRMPPPESLAHGSRLAVLSGARALNPEHYLPVRPLKA